MEESKSSRLILPCANDDGNFMCFICRRSLPSGKTLYKHMRSKPCYSEWENVMPEPKKLINCSTVIVRYTLSTPIPTDSDQSSDLTINEQECSTHDADLIKFLPEWNATGQARNKRRRSDLVVSSAKKIKVADSKNDGVLPEAMGDGGKVVFDFDLNNDPVVITTED
ncbi:hypothetical protein L1987_19729 [Smallanthus sonchifolius]|uniref:Uncharacterized protein n=1 Tax=Smallanthus sonchifolius TaxID=185202 RepID=A0ACB9IQ36_9ASTR|nr:hypothetical protein L1987_19729 [Smallanthus sonchifolius]